VLSGRGLCDELITRPEESYRLCCVVVCDLETSRIGAPYIYDISNLRVNMTRDIKNQTANAKLFSPKQYPKYIRKIYAIIQLLQISNSHKSILLLVDFSTLSLLHYSIIIQILS